jgi:AraC-like DNA-binding protein
MDDLIFLHGSATPRCSAIVDKQFKGYHTVQFMTAGAVDLYYDNEYCALREPSVWTAFPGPHIRFHLAPGARWWSHRYVAFTGPRVGHWVDEGLWFQKPQSALPVEKFEHLFEDLLRHSARNDTLNRRAATAILERILIELAQQRERESYTGDVSWLHGVLVHLESHFNPNYEALARAHNMSLSTLRRRFLQATGRPIHTAVVEARITRARNLLGATDKPIKAIAAELGYADEYFFARQFKATVGVPPAAFRRSRQ